MYYLTCSMPVCRGALVPQSPMLMSHALAMQLLGAAAEAVVHYNAADASMAMLIDVEHVSLQQVLSELGVKANLVSTLLVAQQVYPGARACIKLADAFSNCCSGETVV